MKARGKKRKAEQKAATEAVSQDWDFVKDLATKLAAKKTEQVLGSAENQEAFDAWTQKACEKVASVLCTDQEDVSAMVKPLFEAGVLSVPPDAKSAANATYVEALKARHRNSAAYCATHDDVELVVELESVLAYAAPSSRVQNLKTWTPADADPKRHLQAKDGRKTQEYHHTKWASEEAVGLAQGELMSLLDCCSLMQEDATSREEPLMVLLKEAAKETALVLEAAVHVFDVFLVDGATNNALLKQAIGVALALV